MELNDSDFNSTYDSDYDYDYSARQSLNFYQRLFIELFTLMAVLSLVSNVLTIFLICRHQKLRRNVTNIIILNINIVQAFIFLTSPLLLRFLMEFSKLYLHFSRQRIGSSVICALCNLDVFLMSSLCVFILLLVCNWFIKVYKKESYPKFCHVYKFLILSIYLFIIFSCSVTIQSCFVTEKLYVIHSIHWCILLGFYVILAIFLIVMNIVHRFMSTRETRSNHAGLALANIFIVVWIPLFIYLIFLIFGQHYWHVVGIVCTNLVLTSPVFSFLYLFLYHSDYNIFFKRLVKCESNKYENELLDQEQSVIFRNIDEVESLGENCDY